MIRQFKSGRLQIHCSEVVNANRVAYIIYPFEMLAEWIPTAAKDFDVTIVTITGVDWDNDLSPWPAPGEPPGCPPFQGKAAMLLAQIEDDIVPRVDKALGLAPDVERTMIGVSMAGLFTLWQWMLTDTFRNIGCLSGSFWYPGLMEWLSKRDVPTGKGKAYFLLGEAEPTSPVKAFQSVGRNTKEVVEKMEAAGVETHFDWVPGNHFAAPLPRLDKAFAWIFQR